VAEEYVQHISRHMAIVQDVKSAGLAPLNKNNHKVDGVFDKPD